MLDGVDVSALGKDERADVRNRKIGFVFQGFNLLRRTSALENVELPLIYADVPAGGANAAQPAGAGHRRPGGSARTTSRTSFPGGQQQRVAIARALVNRPRCCWPTSRPATSTAARPSRSWACSSGSTTAGITIVLVTHEPDIAQYAKRIVVDEDGRIILRSAGAEETDARCGAGGVTPLEEMEVRPQ